MFLNSFKYVSKGHLEKLIIITSTNSENKRIMRGDLYWLIIKWY